MSRTFPCWRGCLAIVLAATLTACSGFRSEAQAPVSYLLRAPAVEASASPPMLAGIALRVERVQVPPGFDSDRILVLREPRVLDHYQASRWTGSLPAVLGSLTIETLRGTGAFGSVHEPAASLHSDYSLRLAVRHFEADASAGGPPLVRVQFDCTVSRRADRSVVATFVAAAEVPAEAQRMNAVVAAFDTATGVALTEVTRRTTEILLADLQQP
jgi:ABC-type uncharacterized transport system auxiliary subunit